MDAKRGAAGGQAGLLLAGRRCLGLECVGRPEAQAGLARTGGAKPPRSPHPLGVQRHSVGLDSPPMGAQRIICVPSTEPASLSWAGRGEGPIQAVRILAPWRSK